MQAAINYHPSLAQQKFDVIVVGSGISGLATAAYLTKAGKKVLVLEKHTVPGGFTHTFERKKYEWDVGVHYVGNLHKQDTHLYKAFDYLTDFGVQWESMGEVYDKAIFGKDEYEFISGEANQINRLIQYFPNEEPAIRAYYKLIAKVNGFSSMYLGEKAMPFWLSKTVGWLLRRPIMKYMRQTTYDVLRSLTANEKLIAVLSTQCGNYGLTPKKSPFAVHAIIVGHYLNGGAYPVGNSAQINIKMVEAIVRRGSVVACKATVEKLLVENGAAKGVRMASGEEIFAPIVISSVGAKNTLNHLVKEEHAFDGLRTKVDAIKPSTGHLCISLGLNKSDAELKLPRHNIWFFNSYDIDKDFDDYQDMETQLPPLLYISFPSAKDPSWAAQFPGKASVQIIVPSNYAWFKKWENTRWGRRGEDYDALKEKTTQAILEKAYEVLPQLKGAIEVYDTSTPLSTKHFNNYASGEMYGLEHVRERFEISDLRIFTPVKNFYITGQDIVCVGVGGAWASAMFTASAILKKLLLNIDPGQRPAD